MSQITAFIRREPMVHFTIFALLIFVAHAYWADAGKEIIRVDVAAQEFLIKQREDLLLRPLSETEKQDVIDKFVEEEILWHEARERGLDQTARIRQQMIRGIRFLMMSDLPTPSEAELKAFYDTHQDRFKSPATLALDHVFFLNAGDVPEDLLSSLRAGADHELFGDLNVMLGSRIPAAGQRQLVQVLGAEATRQILAIEDEQWHGPIDSVQGTHFVRIVERSEPFIPTFEQVAPYLEEEWVAARQREVIERELESIRDKYRVIIEKPVATPNG